MYNKIYFKLSILLIIILFPIMSFSQTKIIVIPQCNSLSDWFGLHDYHRDQTNAERAASWVEQNCPQPKIYVPLNTFNERFKAALGNESNNECYDAHENLKDYLLQETSDWNKISSTCRNWLINGNK